MTYPLLTKVLADALEWSACDGESTVRYIPPAIADRLERALDVCAYPTCHRKRAAYAHQHGTQHDSVDHDLGRLCHPYQPLVQP